MRKLMENSSSLAVRLPSNLAEEIRERARQLSLSESAVIRQIITEYLSSTSDSMTWPLRYQAREAAAELRAQGIPAVVTGARGRWKVQKTKEI